VLSVFAEKPVAVLFSKDNGNKKWVPSKGFAVRHDDSSVQYKEKITERVNDPTESYYFTIHNPELAPFNILFQEIDENFDEKVIALKLMPNSSSSPRLSM
jgi:hypothetical protein